MRRGVAHFDCRVVDAVAIDQVLIIDRDGVIQSPVVPDEDHDSANGQLNAECIEFQASDVRFKPVERLPGRDEVDTLVGQSRCFGGAIDAVKILKLTEQGFGSFGRSAFGSTPKTELPSERKGSLRNPVPEPISAMT